MEPHIILTFLILGLPLLGFVTIGLCGKIAKKWAQYVGTATIGVSLILSFILLFMVISRNAAYPVTSFTWFETGKYVLNFGFQIDSLAVIMLVVVSTVSFLVHLFSMDYMKGDPGIARFYAELQLFTVAMLGVVTASNLLQMFAFWELVGLCSYLLIGFWFHKRSVFQAAKKAFFVTKVGDVFLFLGIFAIFYFSGTLDFGSLTSGFKALSETILIVIPLCIFMGAVGKSAQFPLHVWLPNAMEGPTPVSALIHAATMVAAGIYLVARTIPVFIADTTGIALTVVMMVGAVTAFMGATIATVQDDIKKVLAYSTISQLGYMVMGLGAVYAIGGNHPSYAMFGFVAALFHLMTHAFFKGLLFLGSGSVIHATHTQNMHEMGGLIKKMPITGWTFVIGSLALAGFPLFAGFWSKDAIIGAVWSNFAHGHNTWALVAVVLALLGAFLTPYYMTRCVWLTFFGKPRKENHAHEGSWKTTLPLVWLAVLAAGVGFVGIPFWGGDGLIPNFFQSFLGNAYFKATHFISGNATLNIGTTLTDPSHGYETWSQTNPTLFFGAIIIVFAGILTGLIVYVWRPKLKVRLINGLRPIYIFLKNKWYIDEAWTFVAVKPFLWVAEFSSKFDAKVIDGAVNGVSWLTVKFAGVVHWFDSHIVDGAVNGVGWLGVKLSTITKWFDENVVDGLVNGTATVFGETGKQTRKIQTGYLPNYAAVMFASVVVILLIVAIFAL
ncbi:MAG TPA: NADH-quinone oxidoreductase subunit L [Caldisericia bacterium]|nr:NADH-quinone oxidoreductase subunit L [Caldisericia bacterium]HPF49048.1 NADH-quinone oxidoreductase subunit L [Caldisericia bacterium]HPI83088.1 NADH-quinone oxidoreductase subunit L [Caldisericia bacterium]HPQ92315.1 NADH-quinone oxidoreductase subunit L [Caldisericia bacterium]HRV74587.1 NADH-quinone oxidoreductase subunit L [Caldisericia bacterium]